MLPLLQLVGVVKFVVRRMDITSHMDAQRPTSYLCGMLALVYHLCAPVQPHKRMGGLRPFLNASASKACALSLAIFQQDGAGAPQPLHAGGAPTLAAWPAQQRLPAASLPTYPAALDAASLAAWAAQVRLHCC